jgi:hypothetical protein
MNKWQILLLSLVLALGIFIRSIEVINKNPLFGYDQGRDYLAVRKIVVDKKLTLIGAEAGNGYAGLFGVFQGPYYYYLLTVPYIIFNGDPYGGLFLMFVIGVFALLLGFYFTYKEFGYRAGLIMALLMGVALSAQSRFMWPPHPATPLIILIFWLTYKLMDNPRKYFFWATFLAGLIYGFEIAMSVPLILALFIYVFLILKIKDLRVYLRGILGVMLAYSPFLFFEVRHGYMATGSIIKIISGMFTNKSSYDFLKALDSHFWRFYFNFRDTFVLSDANRFRLLVFLLIVIVFYLFKEKKSKEKYFICFLLILPPVTLIAFLPLQVLVYNHFLVHLHITYVFLFAYFFAKSKLPLSKLVFSIFLILMLPYIYKEFTSAKKDLSDYGGEAKIKGKIEAIDYIYNDAKGQNFNVLVFAPPVYDYQYRYMLLWYGQQKYHYLPGDKKEGLFYLWIEQDPKQPWSYRGWLETVVKTGKVIKEEKLSSGFIIQKRYEEK